MQLVWLESFVAVIQKGSFSSAAEALFRSQPRVSAHIAALESDLGVQLFDRRRRPVALTDAGQSFMPYARQILMDLESARSDVSEVTGGRQGNVTLGSYPSASAAFVPDLLTAFAQEYPGIRVHLLDVGSLRLEQALLQRDVNLILRPMRPPLSSGEIVSHVLWSERFQIAVPPTHDLARRNETVAIRDVLKYPLIISGGRVGPRPFETTEIQDLLRHGSGRIKLAYQVTYPQTLIELVRFGHGVGVINRLALQSCNWHDIVVRDLDPNTSTRRVAVCSLKGGMHSTAARVLREFIIAAPRPAGTLPPAK